MTVMQVVVIGVIWLAGANGLFLLFSPIVSPRLFLRYMNLGKRDGWSGDRWWRMPFGLFCMISLGRVIYCALCSVTFVIPGDWGSPNEDGLWESTRATTAFLVAFFATIPLFAALEEAAKALVRD